MASSTYDQRWQEAMAELDEQVHIEDHTLGDDGQEGGGANEPPPQATITEAFQHYASLYIKYIQILTRLADCYDQMVHPQKRIDVKQVLEVVATRVVELKHLLVKWHPPNPDVATQPERPFPWEYVNLDAILVDLKLPPETLEIPVPRSFLDDQADELLRRERLVKGYMKLKHGVDAIYLDELDALKQQLAAPAQLSLDEAIAVIQRNERGRQGRQRGVLVRELREEEKQRALFEASAAGGSPEMDPDIAAANIQRMFRGYHSRAVAARERDEELVFIGMKPSGQDRSALERQLADAKTQRRAEQAANKDEYDAALVELHGTVTTEEGPFLREKLLEERRRWVTDVMATGQLPEDLAGFYAAQAPVDEQQRLAEEEAAKAAAKDDGKGKKDKKGGKKEDAKAKKGGKKDAKGAKGAKGGAEDDEPPPEKPPPLTGPSELGKQLASAVTQYEHVWLARQAQELDNFYQKYDVALAKDVVRGPVEVQVRQQVDEMLVLQLANIKAQMEAAAAAGKKKKKGKGKGGKKKGGKKGGKGKKDKKKKGKALPGEKLAELKGRAPESFLSLLVEQRIVQAPRPDVRLRDYVGSFNLLGTVQHTAAARRDRLGNWVPPDPSAAQLRQALTEYAVLPLGSSFVRARTPLVRSLLLYGPRGAGKTMLASAVANETGALVLNVSPANTTGKFAGKTGPTKLVHMAFLLAKAAGMQPIVVLIDECELVFAGGGGKKKSAAASGDSPARFKKDLLTYIKAALEPQDRVLVIGTTSDPGAAEVKDLRAFFDKFLHVPYPDYAARVLLWKRALDGAVEQHAKALGIQARASVRLARAELDVSTLAHISEGYASGSIVRAVAATLTPRRVECLDKRPLKEDEFLGALARQPATFADDHDKFKQFTAVITGLKDTRDQLRRAAAEALEAKDDKKDKGKKAAKGKK